MHPHLLTSLTVFVITTPQWQLEANMKVRESGANWYLCLLTLFLAMTASTASAEKNHPNFVVIVVDDLRFDEFAAAGHPYLQTPNIDRLATEGAIFTQAYHATPLCSPNRASILTGQYASRHGILDNTSRSHASHQLDLFPKTLQAAGYRTAHVGKWHMGNDPTPRHGYDYWVSFAGQGKTYDPDLYENGETHQIEGYITDIFTDRAVKFISESGNKPFCIYVGHKALHPEAVQLDDGTVDLSVPGEFIPAKRHQGRYKGKEVKRRPNYGFSDQDANSKPVIKSVLEIRRIYEQDEAWAREIDPGVAENTIRRRAEMMLAVDESVGRILDVLKEEAQLDNTMIIFTSDNGYFYGEHGLTIERRLPYEESIRAPVLIRYPKLIQPGRKIGGLTSSIDLAPTILDAAGIDIPNHVQGKSLLPLLRGDQVPVNEAILVEFYSHENPFPWTARLDYRVVRKGKYKYIRWICFENETELYNLEQDPYELDNLIGDLAMAPTVSEMENELRALVLNSLNLAH
jgi:N-acetylglucosamine-6-sulfatase